MVDAPFLDHLWDVQKDCLDVQQVKRFQQETPTKIHNLGTSWQQQMETSNMSDQVLLDR